jgi:tRNA/rRNA methyltransferase
LLTLDQSDRLDVVLVAPRNPLNIGAAARAMANFGFQRLSIVAPFAVNWMEAKSAVGAPDLLRDARVFDTLAEALRDCSLVLGTGSLDRRRPVQTTLGLPEAAALIRKNLAVGLAIENIEAPPQPHNTERVALLFGSEKHGLTTEELSWCHALIVIETCDAQPSMNLGQAVAVCLYEIARTSQFTPTVTPLEKDKSAEHPNSEQLNRLAGLIEETMDGVNYTTRGVSAANGEALRVLLRRLMPNEPDLRRMMGLFRRILWQLRRSNRAR